MSKGEILTSNRLSYRVFGMITPTERRYRRERRYSEQLRVTVEPATVAALKAGRGRGGFVC